FPRKSSVAAPWIVVGRGGGGGFVADPVPVDEAAEAALEVEREPAGELRMGRRAVLTDRCRSIGRHGRHRSGAGDLPEHHRGPRGPDDNRKQGRRRHGGSDPTASLSTLMI